MRYIILLSFLFLIPVSKAEVHIEPYGNVGGSILSNSVYFNYALGARLGYRVLSVATGVDLFWTHYGMGSGSGVRVTDNPSTLPARGMDQVDRSLYIHYSQDPKPFQPFSIGAFAAMELPLLFNAYGTLFYSFGNRESVNHQGYGAKAGISWMSTFYVQLNAELQWARYVCNGQTDAECIDHKNFNVLSAMVSVSVPLSIDIFDFGSSEDSEDSEEISSEIE